MSTLALASGQLGEENLRKWVTGWLYAPESGLQSRRWMCAVYTGHLIYLTKDELDGYRMRSRFWLSDAKGVTEPEERTKAVRPRLMSGFYHHATKDVAVLEDVCRGL